MVTEKQDQNTVRIKFLISWCVGAYLRVPLEDCTQLLLLRHLQGEVVEQEWEVAG